MELELERRHLRQAATEAQQHLGRGLTGDHLPRQLGGLVSQRRHDQAGRGDLCSVRGLPRQAPKNKALVSLKGRDPVVYFLLVAALAATRSLHCAARVAAAERLGDVVDDAVELVRVGQVVGVDVHRILRQRACVAHLHELRGLGSHCLRVAGMNGVCDLGGGQTQHLGKRAAGCDVHAAHRSVEGLVERVRVVIERQHAAIGRRLGRRRDRLQVVGAPTYTEWLKRLGAALLLRAVADDRRRTWRDVQRGHGFCSLAASILRMRVSLTFCPFRCSFAALTSSDISSKSSAVNESNISCAVGSTAAPAGAISRPPK